MPPPSARPSIDRLWLILLAGGVSSAGVGSAMGQHTYTGAAGDNLWCTPGNWDPPSVPSGAAVIGPEITQRVRFASNCTPTFSTLTAQGPVLFDGVVRNSGDILASDIIIQSGSFEVGPATLGSARLSINGVGQWRTGIIARQTVRVEGGATLTVEPPASRTLRTAAMTNFGSVTQRATILLDGLSPIENRGTWTLAAPSVSVARLGIGNPSVFTNIGLLSCAPSGETGAPLMNVPVRNQGRIEAVSGSLDLLEFASVSGQLAASEGRRINLARESTFESSSRCEGDGTIEATVGPVRVLSGALLTAMNAEDAGTGSFTLNCTPGLEISADAMVSNTGVFTWTRGSILAADGSDEIPDGTFVNEGRFVARAASGTLVNLRFYNIANGVVVIDPTTQMLLRDSSIVSTFATVEMRSGAVVRSPLSAPDEPTRLEFFDSLLTKTGPQPARIECPVLMNRAEVAGQEGDLTIGGNIEAHQFDLVRFNTSAGAQISLGSLAHATSPVFEGGGAFRIAQSATLVIDDDEAASAMTGPGDGLVLDGGKITGLGRMVNTGKIRIRSGTLGDADTLAESFELQNSGNVFVVGPGAVRIAATVRNLGGGTLAIDSPVGLAGGALVFNSGAISIGEQADIFRATGFPQPLLTNVGIIDKREPGASVISVPLANTGFVDVRQGTLAITGPLEQLEANQPPQPSGTYTLTDGSYRVGPEGSLNFGGRLVTQLQGDAGMVLFGPCNDFEPTRLRDQSTTEFGTLIDPAEPFIVEDQAELTVQPGGVLGTPPGGSSIANFEDACRLAGSGEIDRDVFLRDLATIAPGLSPGELTLRSLAMQGGILSIELAGPTPATEHDRLTVVNHASLGGTLAISLLDGFSPPAGSSFVILTASSISGGFTRVIQPTGLAPGLRVRPVVGDAAVVLRVTFDADFNGDDFVDFFDYLDFVACFEGDSCPSTASADFNEDGFVDFFDYLDFVTAFEGGG